MDKQVLVESKITREDTEWMRQALELATHGLGHVEPNPLVGCVIVRDSRIVASGFHAKYGHDHAERAAILSAQKQGRANELVGATAYVTLEPCCHHGKTPPCTDLLLSCGIARVVVAMQDPFSAVSGQGIAQLSSAGVEVDVGCEIQAAQALNAAYVKRLQTGRPWIIAKWAMSLDGRIATHTGHSQWISGPASRSHVHQLRSRVDAIIIGRETAQADDPLLTARLPDKASPARVALRVVLDSTASLLPNSQLVQTAGIYPTLIWCGPEAQPLRVQQLESAGCRVVISSINDPVRRLEELLDFLVAQYAATNVLVEGGGQLLGSLFDIRQIDQCEVFIAPKLIGGAGALSPIAGIGVVNVDAGPHCEQPRWQTSGQDLHFSCTLNWSTRSDLQ